MHDLNELHAFVSVMESGNLGQSARQLGLAKSTLSRRISQLEARLGQPLLRRQANRLMPTEAGTVYHNYCRQILHLADQSQQALDDLKEAVSGELTVHVHSVFMRGWFSRRVEEFLDDYPGVRLTLCTQLQAPCDPGENAICLWLGSVVECGLRQERLGQLQRGFYANPDYLARHGTPGHPRELAGHAWVDLLGETADGLTLQHAREGAYEMTPLLSRLKVDQYVLQIDAITRCQGLGILPRWMATQYARAHPGTLVPCLEAWYPPAVPVTLLYPFGRLPRKTTRLLEHLRQAVPSAWREHAPSAEGAAALTMA
ncbi:LysR family transcriptional regulator [Modicisalibacter radicis]|uniref:LysR family transcriptional regulator n=1 Tax=Halomonas sp. EAR18 TaxID=2518972 RepID=UPI00109C9512|nr:LysR family transcriptional regulator [Halomonas sp. EAR18]